MTEPKKSLISRMTLARWVSLVLVIVAVVFIFQNTATTSIQLFWVSVETPLWFTLLVVFVVGWLAGFLTGRRRGGSRTTS
jgi:uncharacterized integral membrane protein